MKIEIETGNEAFHGELRQDCAEECARILRKLATDLESRGMPVAGYKWPLADLNGNKVGTCSA